MSKPRHAPVYERVAAFWELVEKWTREHRPEIHASLAPGAGRAEFEALETRAGQRLPDVVCAAPRDKRDLRTGERNKKSRGTNGFMYRSKRIHR
jgi:hypothetical protein